MLGSDYLLVPERHSKFPFVRLDWLNRRHGGRRCTAAAVLGDSTRSFGRGGRTQGSVTLAMKLQVAFALGVMAADHSQQAAARLPWDNLQQAAREAWNAAPSLKPPPPGCG